MISLQFGTIVTVSVKDMSFWDFVINIRDEHRC